MVNFFHNFVLFSLENPEKENVQNEEAKLNTPTPIKDRFKLRAKNKKRRKRSATVSEGMTSSDTKSMMVPTMFVWSSDPDQPMTPLRGTIHLQF